MTRANVSSGQYVERRDIWYRLLWAARKIISRDPLYLPRRLSYSVRSLVVRRTFRVLLTRYGLPKASVAKDAAHLLGHFRTRENPRFHFCSSHIGPIVLRIPEHIRKATVEAAENIVRGKFTHKGVGPILLDPIDWEFQPNNASAWLWHSNRHFTFTQLGFAYWYTQDGRFAESFLRLAESWIDRYIPRLGRIHWDHPFEVGARVNAWIWAYFLFLSSPCMTPEFHLKFLSALGRLTEYLFRVIEYHNQGNHILLEAKALALCAGLFPELEGSARWLKKAWKIIDRELHAQICIDGVHAERSGMYHRIVAGELAELLLFCRRNACESKDLAGIVCRMADFESWMAGGLAEMPVIGDAFREDNYFRFSAPMIAAALGCPSATVPVGARCDEQTDWALGVDISQDNCSDHLPPIPQELAKAFPEGGYFISRSGWDRGASVLIWDCGPVGYHANRYHSHLDALSFNLTVSGVPLIIDPGIVEGDMAGNRKLRSTSAHNTVVVDCADQSILAPMGANTEVWSPANAYLHLWASCPECDVMTGSHDGYGRLRMPAQHVRVIIVMRGRYWLILDRLKGNGVHRADQRFHIAPSASVTMEASASRFDIAKGGVSAALYSKVFCGVSAAAVNPMMTIETCSTQLTANQPEEIKVINMRLEAQTPLDFGVVVSPSSEALQGVDFQATDYCSIRLVRIRGLDYSDDVYVGNVSRETTFRIDDWQTDADVFVVRRFHESKSAVFAFNASSLKLAGEDILKGHKKSKIAHLSFDNGTWSEI